MKHLVHNRHSITASAPVQASTLFCSWRLSFRLQFLHVFGFRNLPSAFWYTRERAFQDVVNKHSSKCQNYWKDIYKNTPSEDLKKIRRGCEGQPKTLSSESKNTFHGTKQHKLLFKSKNLRRQKKLFYWHKVKFPNLAVKIWWFFCTKILKWIAITK